MQLAGGGSAVDFEILADFIAPFSQSHVKEDRSTRLSLLAIGLKTSR